jgi:SAM-dependent methyltransferase
MSKPYFDLSYEYDQMLEKGIRLSGEDKHYFIEHRVQDLASNLPRDFHPLRILDFGCGIGDTSSHLAKAFPGAEVVGTDNAESALDHARGKHGSSRVSFIHLDNFVETGTFDLCYVNGVFHHIRPDLLPPTVKRIHKALKPGGFFALFENNPWNLGTRMVMSRIPFDRDARLLSPFNCRNLLREGGFDCSRPIRSLFYFPRFLAFLRFSEPWLANLLLGCQYYVLAVKPGGPR